MAASMTFMPPGRRMSAVEKLVWAPAPGNQSEVSTVVTWLLSPIRQSQLTVPVPGHRLGVEADHDPELLCDPEQEVARHPQVVTHVDTLGRANLGKQ